MQLLIMAAGMGSRFGGLKQIEPMGPNGEFIIDYSIYDAVSMGFDEVIFIIKEENYEIFKNTIGKRVESFVKVKYVFQKMDNIPDFVKIPENRIKPWGTAQAIYCAKDVIKDKFLVINADDFYGLDAFRTASEFINNSKEKEYAIIAYYAVNTMTDIGSVKRGVLSADNDNNMDKLIECSIIKDKDSILCKPLNGDNEFYIKYDNLVSMNMLVLDKSIFPYLDAKMNDFFQSNVDNLEKCEFLIPDVLYDAKRESYAKVKVVKTNANWYGVTYHDDLIYVKDAIKKLVDDGEYPNYLWK